MGTTGACGGTHGRGEGGATPAARRTTGRGAAQTEREMLRRCPLFDGMGEADFDAAIAFLGAHVRRVPKGEPVSRYRSKVRDVLYILDGTVRLELFDAWGHRALLGLKVDGFLTNAIAIFHDQPTFFSLVAETNCAVVAFDRKQARALLTDPEVPAGLQGACRLFGYNLTACLADNLAKTLQRENYLAQHSVRERIGLYLSSCAERAGNRSFSLDMTRQQLADFLSMDRSTLCEELSRMAREGLIRYHLNDFELL